MNKNTINRNRVFPWHPVLLSFFPTLALLANNIAEIEMRDALRSLMVSIAMAILLMVILRLILRDLYKAAAITSFALVLFFSYGHIYQVLETSNLVGMSFGRHRILAPIYLVIFAIGVWWITKPSRTFGILTRTLNVVALVAVALPVLQMTIGFIQEARAGSAEPSNASQGVHVSRDKPSPDIYYIILDGYSRDDILKDFYNFDNSAFLSDLTDLGFYVARCSQSNYAQTQLSLASALNMEFIDELSGYFSPNQTNRVGMPGLIKRSSTRRLLESLGYKTVAFETGYNWTQVEDADVYLSPKSSKVSLLDVTGGLNSFESLLIKTSAMLILVDAASALPKFLQLDINYPNQIHRERVLFTLDQLEKLPSMPGPKFVFAHIVSPHKPFVFGPHGEIVKQEKDDITGYRGQVAYLNSRLIPILQKIISNSSTPPIIILQGDHAGIETTEQDRMAILNAYYLPEGGNQVLYENISPVNTFRKIFNRYFGTSYDLLDDVSYYSSYQHPYQYTIIPNARLGCP